MVKVKFKVDKDGSVNTFEIVTSGGDEFDGEVLRVVKGCPVGCRPSRMALMCR